MIPFHIFWPRNARLWLCSIWDRCLDALTLIAVGKCDFSEDFLCRVGCPGITFDQPTGQPTESYAPNHRLLDRGPVYIDASQVIITGFLSPFFSRVAFPADLNETKARGKGSSSSVGIWWAKCRDILRTKQTFHLFVFYIINQVSWT